MKRSLIVSLVLALGLGLSLGVVGCGDDDVTTPGLTEFEKLAGLGDTYFGNYTTPDGMSVNTLAADVYANLIDGNAANDPYIIDWRTPEHFALGHIAGAVNVGKVTTVDFAAVIAAIPAGKTILNVCYSGQTASYATSVMNMLGFNAQNLKFGMCGWTTDQAVNLSKWDNNIGNDFNTWLVTTTSTATQTYDPPVISTGQSDPVAILQARGNAMFTTGWKTITATALFEEIEVNGNADDYFIVNYFNLAQYDAGHIPGAVRYQPKQDLNASAKLNMLPTDKKIVVYCFTGQTSAQVIGYLNALGYDAYSLPFGVNGMCYDNTQVCTTQYHAPATSYPVVTGM